MRKAGDEDEEALYLRRPLWPERAHGQLPPSSGSANGRWDQVNDARMENGSNKENGMEN